MHREKHFYFKMLITFEPNVAQRSVASQNDHKSKACLPEASNTASTMYRCLKRRLRRLYEAPFLATFFWRLTALVITYDKPLIHFGTDILKIVAVLVFFNGS